MIIGPIVIVEPVVIHLVSVKIQCALCRVDFTIFIF